MNLRNATPADLKNELEIKEILAFTESLTERKNMITITRINKRTAVIDVNGRKTVIKKTRPGRGVSRGNSTKSVYQSVAPVSRV